MENRCNMEKIKIQDAVLIDNYEEVDNLELSKITHNPTDAQRLSGLIVRGYETKFAKGTNENREQYDPHCFDEFVENFFVKNKLNIPVTFEHMRDELIGRVLCFEVNSVGFYFVIYIPKRLKDYDDIKVMIEEGLLQGLSKEGWATDYEYIWKKDGSFDYMKINKMEIVSVSLVACPANGEPLERAEEIKNATHFKKLENKNNTNIDEMFV